MHQSLEGGKYLLKEVIWREVLHPSVNFSLFYFAASLFPYLLSFAPHTIVQMNVYPLFPY